MTDTAKNASTTIVCTSDVDVPAARVLELARDFSARRADVFPAVSTKRLTVHSSGPTTADVTEGTRFGLFVFWERCTYEWSQPGLVTATVTDSNIYGVPGSSWTIRAEPTKQGSRVEMTWTRCFRRRPVPRLMGFMFRHRGEQIFGKYAQEVSDNFDSPEAPTPA